MILNKNGKGFLLLLIVILVSLGISAGIYFLYYQEKGRNVELSSELAAAQAKVASLQSQVEESASKVAGLQSQIAKLTEDLETEKQNSQGSVTQLAELKQALEQERALKAELEKKYAESQETLKTLNVRLQEMDSQVRELESVKIELESKIKANDLKKNVELGKIVVGQEDGSATTVVSDKQGKPLEGKILVVNKDYNFAVINLGNKDGIAIGNVFSVYRNNKAVADLKIEKVHDSMSAAGFTPDIKNKIAEGDRVELKTK